MTQKSKKIFHKKNLYTYQEGDAVVWESFSGEIVEATICNFSIPPSDPDYGNPNSHPTLLYIRFKHRKDWQHERECFWVAKSRVMPLAEWKAKNSESTPPNPI